MLLWTLGYMDLFELEISLDMCPGVRFLDHISPIFKFKFNLLKFLFAAFPSRPTLISFGSKEGLHQRVGRTSSGSWVQACLHTGSPSGISSEDSRALGGSSGCAFLEARRPCCSHAMLSLPLHFSGHPILFFIIINAISWSSYYTGSLQRIKSK